MFLIWLIKGTIHRPLAALKCSDVTEELSKMGYDIIYPWLIFNCWVEFWNSFCLRNSRRVRWTRYCHQSLHPNVWNVNWITDANTRACISYLWIFSFWEMKGRWSHDFLSKRKIQTILCLYGWLAQTDWREMSVFPSIHFFWWNLIKPSLLHAFLHCVTLCLLISNLIQAGIVMQAEKKRENKGAARWGGGYITCRLCYVRQDKCVYWSFTSQWHWPPHPLGGMS